MYDSEYNDVKKILDANGITDIDDVEYGSECFDELMDYYADEMPYGVQKARTGMPDEWIFEKLCDLGIDKELEQEQEHMAKHYKWKDMI